MMFRRLLPLGLACALGLTGSAAWAWGATGHRLVSRIAAESLPPEVPAFLRTPEAAFQIGELGREPDRSKGSGQPHDADLDPGHFVDLDDAGKVMGGPALNALPRDREAYDTALRAVGSDASKAGWLPYSLNDGWEQLVHDFAYWRVDSAAEKRAVTDRERAYYAADRKLREEITIRDLGYWSHFVGDASQPMHVSIHFNGWGNYPNPNNYTQDKIHGPFEGPFVHDNIKDSDVRAALTPPQLCGAPIQACTAAYLAATQAKVEPLYTLWKAGGFQPGDPRGKAFATERLAAGASMLRDLVASAWRASADATLGYPAIKVRDVEEGRIASPYDALYGED